VRSLQVVVAGYASLDRILPVDRLAGPDTTGILQADPSAIADSYGGCALNVAVSLARLGIAAGVITTLGDDAAGQDYRDYLAAQGVDISGVTMRLGASTPRSLLLRDPEGSTACYYYPAGAAGDWSAQQALLRRVQWLVVTVGDAQENQRLVAEARHLRRRIAWGMKADAQAYPLPLLQELSASAHLLVCNQREAEHLCRVLGVAGPEELVRRGGGTVVVTRGGQGCLVCTAHGLAEVPAVPPQQLVDSTGAGDAFLAGLLFGLLQGRAPSAAAALGAVNASFVLQALGCQTSLPGRELLLARAAQYNLG